MSSFWLVVKRDLFHRNRCQHGQCGRDTVQSEGLLFKFYSAKQQTTPYDPGDDDHFAANTVSLASVAVSWPGVSISEMIRATSMEGTATASTRAP
jgi:hypothetical protein